MSTLALPQLITNSRLSCKKACPRKHYFRYELGVRPESEANYFRIGGCFHKGVELGKAGPNPYPGSPELNAAIEQAVQQYETVNPAWDDERVYDWMIEREIVANMLAGYFWRWHGNDVIAEVIAAELPFQIPIRNPKNGQQAWYWGWSVDPREGTRTRVKVTPLLAGKIDGIVRLKDGRIAIHELKTTGDDITAGSDYWSKLRIDSQISTYYHAAKELGHDVETILYDVAKKPAMRPCQVPLVDENDVKIVHDAAGHRVKTKDGKKWRESGDAAQGFTLQTRRETPAEFGARFLADITLRPDHYFQRVEIPRLDADIAEFQSELWDQQLDLRQAQKSGRWYRNTNQCVTFGKCEYFGICTNSIEVDPNNPPAGFARVADIHPELKG